MVTRRECSPDDERRPTGMPKLTNAPGRSFVRPETASSKARARRWPETVQIRVDRFISRTSVTTFETSDRVMSS
jgi:hypothetical protein